MLSCDIQALHIILPNLEKKFSDCIVLKNGNYVIDVVRRDAINNGGS